MSLITFARGKSPRNENIADIFNNDIIVNDEFFSLGKYLPPVNVKERKNNFIIELSAPGFNKDDFKITLDQDQLEISARKRKEEIKEEEDFTRREFIYNAFKKSLQIPAKLDIDKMAKATYKNGILKLKFPKKEASKDKPKRHIEVG